MAKKTYPTPSLIVGWREVVALPQLGAQEIRAKVDTGARTSALHAEGVEIVGEGKARRAQFRLYCELQGRLVEASAPVVDHRSVRSSTGHEQQRPIIRTTLQLAGISFEIEVSLVDRASMGYAMLFGRTALRYRFLVDSGGSYLHGKPSRREHDGAHRRV